METATIIDIPSDDATNNMQATKVQASWRGRMARRAKAVKDKVTGSLTSSKDGPTTACAGEIRRSAVPPCPQGGTDADASAD